LDTGKDVVNITDDREMPEKMGAAMRKMFEMVSRVGDVIQYTAWDFFYQFQSHQPKYEAYCIGISEKSGCIMHLF
jgi:hypothetical protein